MLNRNNKIKAALLTALIAFPTITAAGVPSGFETGIDRFIERMHKKYGFEKNKLKQQITPKRYRQSIINAITRPAEAKPWYKYRPIFVTESRTTQGVEFWEQNETLLKQAEAEYGVPAEIIVAIIGVETRYGRHTGKFPVLDALTTLGFGYPKRGKFFQRELEEYLLLCREEGISPEQAKGSYAGALGKPQFIPSSYRAYSVDFDGDGKRDLWNNNADVIGSVAAYFKDHGWKPGKAITQRVNGANSAHRHYVKAGMKPSITIDELKAAGIDAAPSLPGEALSSLIKLKQRHGSEYWLGLHNFYVITRYNHSNLYAMAVYQLSQKILEKRNGAK